MFNHDLKKQLKISGWGTVESQSKNKTKQKHLGTVHKGRLRSSSGVVPRVVQDRLLIKSTFIVKTLRIFLDHNIFISQKILKIPLMDFSIRFHSGDLTSTCMGHCPVKMSIMREWLWTLEQCYKIKCFIKCLFVCVFDQDLQSALKWVLLKHSQLNTV